MPLLHRGCDATPGVHQGQQATWPIVLCRHRRPPMALVVRQRDGAAASTSCGTQPHADLEAGTTPFAFALGQL